MCGKEKKCIIVILLSLINSYVLYGNDVLDNKILPSEYQGLGDDKKKELLENIAIQSYEILKQVPDKGLPDSKNDILRVLKSRKWLENTNDMMARMLAMILQFNIDSCVINEVIKAELFDTEAMDKNLEKVLSNDKIARVLFAANDVDKKEYIQFSLANNARLLEMCQEAKVNSNHFVDKNLYRKIPKNILGSEIKLKHTRTKIIEKVKLRKDVNIIPTLFNIGQRMASKEDIRSTLLQSSIKLFEAKEDVRFVFKVFQNDRKSAKKKIKKGMAFGVDKGLRECMEIEWSKNQTKHVAFVYDEKSNRRNMIRINECINERIQTEENDGFILILNISTRLFIQKKGVYSEKDQRFIDNIGCGRWLEFIP